MTKGDPAWEKFEHKVQRLLDLRSTPGSGNQWHDVSDGRSRPGDPYRLMVDCKFTDRKSYSLNGDVLDGWYSKAAVLGYRFGLPVRLDGASGTIKEWVAVPLDDYCELVDAFRVLNNPNRCGVRLGSESAPCCRRAGHFGHHDNGEKEWSA